MKNKMIFILLVILLSACKNESKTNIKLSINSTFPHLTLIDNKGNEIMYMNFYDDGTLYSFQVIDRDRYFSVVFNFDTNYINSYSVTDEPSNYGSTTMFYPDENSKLFRMEMFDKLRVTEHILNDENVIIKTSIFDDYLQDFREDSFMEMHLRK